MQMKISVVIPNFNGSMLLKENLPHLYNALKISNLPFEIIIADDKSTDDSIAFIKQNYNDIILIENTSTLGFSANCNTGFNIAKHDWILAMNTDVKLDENYFEPFVKYLNNNNLFSVGGAIYGYDNQLQDAGKFPAWGLQGLKTTVDFEQKDYITSVSTLFNSGACVLYNRKKLMLLKGYDELFTPFYYEDAEICLRALRMGWECLYIPGAVCYHPNSATIQKHHPEEYVKVIANRNKLILGYLHYDGMHRNTFYIMIYLKLLVCWAGKIWFYKSFAGFNNMTTQLRKRKQENKYPITLSVVCTKLKADLKGKVQRLF